MPGLTEGTMTTTSLNNPIKILLLDSDASSVKQVQKQLATDGLAIEATGIETCKQLNDELQKNAYDVIFVSDNARDCSGMVALNTASQLAVATPVVILSEILHEENIINYLQHGASDYVLKSGLQRLASVLQRVVNTTVNSKSIDYQHFFENAPDMLCSCDNEGYFLVVNPAWEKTLGFDSSEILGKSYIQFVHPDDRRSAAAQYQKLFDANSHSPNLVSRFQTKTGELKWLHWKMIMHSAGTVDAIVRDVTEFKTRELQLTQTCVKLKKLNLLYKDDIAKKTLVAEQIRDSVIVTNLKGLIVSWNKGSEKIFGYTEKETVGQHIAMIYPQQDYKYIQEEATNILLEQGEKEFSLHMLRKSGEIFEALLRLEVTRDKDGTVNGMLGYAIDMGPVRPVSDEMPQVQSAELPEAPQQIAHQEQEQQPDQLPEQHPQQSQDASQSTQLNDAPSLDLKPEVEPDLESNLEPELEYKLAPESETELQAHAEPQSQADQTASDEQNSVPETASIETHSDQQADPVSAETSDSPAQPMIEPSAVQAEKITEPPANETQDQSTQQANTDIVGQPLMDAEYRATPDDAQESATEQHIVLEKVFVPRADGSKITIMYLEDNMNHICQVEKVLAQRKGYLLITTQEPEDWLDMAKQYSPALILLDMDLPDADAYALRKMLLEQDNLKHIPVVAVSSDTSDAATNSAKRAGFSDYLGKPIEADRLYNSIDALLYSGKANAI